jgi:TRAP-type uncharacterized transport system fused permease subunit
MPTVLYYLSILLMIQGDATKVRGAHVRGAEVQGAEVRGVDVQSADVQSAAVVDHFAMPSSGSSAARRSLEPAWDAAPESFEPVEPPEPSGVLRHSYHFTSLVLVAALMVIGFTAFRAVFWASVAAIVLSFLGRRHEWLGPRQIVQAMVAGAEDVLPVLATTAVAGIIVGVVTLTGLGLKAAGLIVGLADGSVFLTVLFAAIAVWILGLAVPVTASYIISAVMVVPALTAVGVPPIAAHMFIFYYAVLSEVSPPTALAPFAAAALTGGRPFRTMVLTWKYALPAFVVPFAFTLDARGRGILLQADWMTVILTGVSAVAGVAALAVAAAGLGGRVTLGARVAAAVGGMLLVHPSPIADLVGLAVAGAAALIAPRTRT